MSWCSVSIDGLQLVALPSFNQIKLVEKHDFTLVDTIYPTGHIDQITAVTWNDHKGFLASVSKRAFVIHIPETRFHDRKVQWRHLVLHSGGNGDPQPTLAAASSPASVHSPLPTIESVAWSPCANSLVTAGSGLTVWNLNTRRSDSTDSPTCSRQDVSYELVWSYPKEQCEVVEFSPRSSVFASLDDAQNYVLIWRRRKLNAAHSNGNDNPTTLVEFRPFPLKHDQEVLFFQWKPSVLNIYDRESNSSYNSPLTLFTVCADNSIRVWIEINGIEFRCYITIRPEFNLQIARWMNPRARSISEERFRDGNGGRYDWIATVDETGVMHVWKLYDMEGYMLSDPFAEKTKFRLCIADGDMEQSQKEKRKTGDEDFLEGILYPELLDLQVDGFFSQEFTGDPSTIEVLLERTDHILFACDIDVVSGFSKPSIKSKSWQRGHVTNIQAVTTHPYLPLVASVSKGIRERETEVHPSEVMIFWLPTILSSNTKTNMYPSGLICCPLEHGEVRCIQWIPTLHFEPFPMLLVVYSSGIIEIYGVQAGKPASLLRSPVNAVPHSPVSNSHGSPRSPVHCPWTFYESTTGETGMEYEVLLHPDPKDGVGLVLDEIEGRIVATRFKTSAETHKKLPAELCGQISLNDELVSVNGTSLYSKHLPEVFQLVRDGAKTGQPYLLRFRSNPSGSNESETEPPKGYNVHSSNVDSSSARSTKRRGLVARSSLVTHADDEEEDQTDVEGLAKRETVPDPPLPNLLSGSTSGSMNRQMKSRMARFSMVTHADDDDDDDDETRNQGKLSPQQNLQRQSTGLKAVPEKKITSDLQRSINALSVEIPPVSDFLPEKATLSARSSFRRRRSCVSAGSISLYGGWVKFCSIYSEGSVDIVSVSPLYTEEGEPISGEILMFGLVSKTGQEFSSAEPSSDRRRSLKLWKVSSSGESVHVTALESEGIDSLYVNNISTFATERDSREKTFHHDHDLYHETINGMHSVLFVGLKSGGLDYWRVCVDKSGSTAYFRLTSAARKNGNARISDIKAQEAISLGPLSMFRRGYVSCEVLAGRTGIVHMEVDNPNRIAIVDGSNLSVVEIWEGISGLGIYRLEERIVVENNDRITGTCWCKHEETMDMLLVHLEGGGFWSYKFDLHAHHWVAHRLFEPQSESSSASALRYTHFDCTRDVSALVIGCRAIDNIGSNDANGVNDVNDLNYVFSSARLNEKTADGDVISFNEIPEIVGSWGVESKGSTCKRIESPLQTRTFNSVDKSCSASYEKRANLPDWHPFVLLSDFFGLASRIEKITKKKLASDKPHYVADDVLQQLSHFLKQFLNVLEDEQLAKQSHLNGLLVFPPTIVDDDEQEPDYAKNKEKFKKRRRSLRVSLSHAFGQEPSSSETGAAPKGESRAEDLFRSDFRRPAASALFDTSDRLFSSGAGVGGVSVATGSTLATPIADCTLEDHEMEKMRAETEKEIRRRIGWKNTQDAWMDENQSARGFLLRNFSMDDIVLFLALLRLVKRMKSLPFSLHKRADMAAQRCFLGITMAECLHEVKKEYRELLQEYVDCQAKRRPNAKVEPVAMSIHTDAVSIPSSCFMWGFHSESQSFLFEALTENARQWADLTHLWLGLWVQDDKMLYNLVERMGKRIFAAEKDAMKVALHFAMLGKLQILSAFAKVSSNSRNANQNLQMFLSHDFTQERWQRAAVKNAYSLMQKKQYETAIAFFLLPNPPKLSEAIRLCINRLNNPGLALIIARVVEYRTRSTSTFRTECAIRKPHIGDPSGHHHSIQLTSIAPTAAFVSLYLEECSAESGKKRVDNCFGEGGDRKIAIGKETKKLIKNELVHDFHEIKDAWLESLAQWLIGEYEQSVTLLLPSSQPVDMQSDHNNTLRTQSTDTERNECLLRSLSDRISACQISRSTNYIMNLSSLPLYFQFLYSSLEGNFFTKPSQLTRRFLTPSYCLSTVEIEHAFSYVAYVCKRSGLMSISLVQMLQAKHLIDLHFQMAKLEAQDSEEVDNDAQSHGETLQTGPDVSSEVNSVLSSPESRRSSHVQHPSEPLMSFSSSIFDNFDANSNVNGSLSGPPNASPMSSRSSSSLSLSEHGAQSFGLESFTGDGLLPPIMPSLRSRLESEGGQSVMSWGSFCEENGNGHESNVNGKDPSPSSFVLSPGFMEETRDMLTKQRRKSKLPKWMKGETAHIDGRLWCSSTFISRLVADRVAKQLNAFIDVSIDEVCGGKEEEIFRENLCPLVYLESLCTAFVKVFDVEKESILYATLGYLQPHAEKHFAACVFLLLKLGKEHVMHEWIEYITLNVLQSMEELATAEITEEYLDMIENLNKQFLYLQWYASLDIAPTPNTKPCTSRFTLSTELSSIITAAIRVGCLVRAWCYGDDQAVNRILFSKMTSLDETMTPEANHDYEMERSAFETLYQGNAEMFQLVNSQKEEYSNGLRRQFGYSFLSISQLSSSKLSSMSEEERHKRLKSFFEIILMVQVLRTMYSNLQQFLASSYKKTVQFVPLKKDSIYLSSGFFIPEKLWSNWKSKPLDGIKKWFTHIEGHLQKVLQELLSIQQEHRYETTSNSSSYSSSVRSSINCFCGLYGMDTNTIVNVEGTQSTTSSLTSVDNNSSSGHHHQHRHHHPHLHFLKIFKSKSCKSHHHDRDNAASRCEKITPKDSQSLYNEGDTVDKSIDSVLSYIVAPEERVVDGAPNSTSGNVPSSRPSPNASSSSVSKSSPGSLLSLSLPSFPKSAMNSSLHQAQVEILAICMQHPRDGVALKQRRFRMEPRVTIECFSLQSGFDWCRYHHVCTNIGQARRLFKLMCRMRILRLLVRRSTKTDSPHHRSTGFSISGSSSSSSSSSSSNSHDERFLDEIYTFVNPWEVEAMLNLKKYMQGGRKVMPKHIELGWDSLLSMSDPSGMEPYKRHLFSQSVFQRKLWDNVRGEGWIITAITQMFMEGILPTIRKQKVRKGSPSGSSSVLRLPSDVQRVEYLNDLFRYAEKNQLFYRLNLPHRFIAVIEVQLIEGKDLIPCNILSTSSDPYVFMALSTSIDKDQTPNTWALSTYRSRVGYGGLNPKWGTSKDRYTFRMALPSHPSFHQQYYTNSSVSDELLLSSPTIQDLYRKSCYRGPPVFLNCTVYCKSKVRTHPFMGRAAIPLDDLTQWNSLNKWVKLQGVPDGFLHMKLSMKYQLLCSDQPDEPTSVTDGSNFEASPRHSSASIGLVMDSKLR